MKMVSEKYARKYYNIGRKIRDQIKKERLNEEEKNMLIYKYSDSHNWEALEMINLGINQEFPFKIKKYYRYGGFPVDNAGYVCPSRNASENRRESGVSVATPEWEQTTSGMYIVAKKGHTKIEFQGIQIGWGGDGEPVVLPIQPSDQKEA